MPINLELIHQPITPSENEFMLRHMHRDILADMLNAKFTPRERLLLKQLFLRQRLEKKLPSIYNNKGWIIPEQLNTEQASSEKTAKYKASIVKGERMFDLTLGMGIDTFYMSKSFQHVTAIEQNVELAELTRYNLNIIQGITHVNVIGGETSEDFIKQFKDKVDLIYIDPARRHSEGSKLVQLQDCSPNVLDILPVITSKTKQVLLKTSPILDIQQALQLLPHVKSCHILEADKECKELLFHLDFEFEGQTEIIVANLDNSTSLSATFESENEVNIEYSLPLNFLYEPGPAFLKSGLFKSIANETNTKKLHPNSHLYTSQELISNFPGRKFLFKSLLKPNIKELKNSLPSLQANLTLRNYPGQTTDLAKKLKLKDGGLDYLFATTLLTEDKVILHCTKI